MNNKKQETYVAGPEVPTDAVWSNGVDTLLQEQGNKQYHLVRKTSVAFLTLTEDAAQRMAHAILARKIDKSKYQEFRHCSHDSRFVFMDSHKDGWGLQVLWDADTNTDDCTLLVHFEDSELLGLRDWINSLGIPECE